MHTHKQLFHYLSWYIHEIKKNTLSSCEGLNMGPLNIQSDVLTIELPQHLGTWAEDITTSSNAHRTYMSLHSQVYLSFPTMNHSMCLIPRGGLGQGLSMESPIPAKDNWTVEEWRWRKSLVELHLARESTESSLSSRLGASRTIQSQAAALTLWSEDA